MAAKRERINPGRGGARYVRRDKQGQFKEVESVGRSLQQDRARKAKNTASSGQGDKGDRKTSSRAGSRGRTRASSNSRSTRARATKRGGGRK